MGPQGVLEALLLRLCRRPRDSRGRHLPVPLPGRGCRHCRRLLPVGPSARAPTAARQLHHALLSVGIGPGGIISRKKVGFPVPLGSIPFNSSKAATPMDAWLEFNLMEFTGAREG